MFRITDLIGRHDVLLPINHNHYTEFPTKVKVSFEKEFIIVIFKYHNEKYGE